MKLIERKTVVDEQAEARNELARLTYERDYDDWMKGNESRWLPIPAPFLLPLKNTISWSETEQEFIERLTDVVQVLTNNKGEIRAAVVKDKQ